MPFGKLLVHRISLTISQPQSLTLFLPAGVPDVEGGPLSKYPWPWEKMGKVVFNLVPDTVTKSKFYLILSVATVPLKTASR